MEHSPESTETFRRSSSADQADVEKAPLKVLNCDRLYDQSHTHLGNILLVRPDTRAPKECSLLLSKHLSFFLFHSSWLLSAVLCFQQLVSYHLHLFSKRDLAREFVTEQAEGNDGERLFCNRQHLWHV